MKQADELRALAKKIRDLPGTVQYDFELSAPDSDACEKAADAIEALAARVQELEVTLNADDRDRKASPLNVTCTVKLRYVERDPLANPRSET